MWYRLTRGADSCLGNSDGQLAIKIAASKEHENIVDLFHDFVKQSVENEPPQKKNVNMVRLSIKESELEHLTLT